MPKRPATDRDARERALQRAAEIGAAAAGRELGIPAATIRAWRARSGDIAAPAAAKPTSWAERRSHGADRTWEVALSATRKALQLIEAGDMLAAQRCMISAGIAADKSGQLEEAAGRSHERHVRITTAQAELIAAVLQAFLEALGLSQLPAAPQIMRALLQQVVAGETIVVSPADAEAARIQLRGAIERELEQTPPRPELPKFREPGRCSTRKLQVESESKPDMAPVGDDVEPGGDAGVESGGDDGVEPDGYPGIHLELDDRDQIRVHDLDRVDGDAGEEVVDAVLVDEPPIPQLWLDAYHGDERLARGAFDRARAREQERERREAERPATLITTRPSVHHLEGPRFGPPGGGV